ncbi:hypothetical protein Daus18300_011182 [Diaporthe australafricana]|uniref:BTB domain-containing protein n=1 Tax=Diaporthe australafricana TaxID=127596 RepID=A0ABR3W7N6_9PEZI
MGSTTPPLDPQVEEEYHDMTAKLDKLAKQNLDLLTSGNFADAEIVCQGKTWKVHRLILRSRCAWFEKAFTNSWKEGETGQVHLEEETPEQVTELLKYIYSCRYAPALAPTAKCISAAILESNVALWYSADFFLLPDLKADIHEYLLNRFSATLHFFHDFSLSLATPGGIWSNNVHHELKDDLRGFFVDFSRALVKIYKIPRARETQKLFAIFACGLRENLPAQTMWSLMETVPKFQKDVSVVLIALHFPNATNSDFVSYGLKALYVDSASDSCSTWSDEGSGSFQCAGCDTTKSSGVLTRSGQGAIWAMTLDPFSMGTRKWCDECAFGSIKFRLQILIKRWPRGLEPSN